MLFYAWVFTIFISLLGIGISSIKSNNSLPHLMSLALKFIFIYLFLQNNKHLYELRQERGLICLSGPRFLQVELLLALWRIGCLSAWQHWPWSWSYAHKKLALLELLLGKTADFGMLFFLSSEFSLITSCLKSLPPQESAWPPSCFPGAVPRGTPTAVGPWGRAVCCWMRCRQHQ